MAAAPLPLAGRRVAVTRAGGADDPLARALVALGAEVLDAPSIAIADPERWDELDRALREVDSFDWIAFASAVAVERTVARARTLGVAPESLRRPALAAVGRATGRRIAELVREPDLVPEEANGAALAGALAPRVARRRVLVPRAAEGRTELLDGLARAGAEVAAPVVYRTVPVSPDALAPLRAALETGTVDAVLFASPSAVRSVVAALGPVRALLARVTVGAIGPTTAAALASLEIPVHVQPGAATVADLALAVADRLGAGARPEETGPTR